VAALTNAERQRRWRERQPKHPRTPRVIPAPEKIAQLPLELTDNQLRRRRRREVEYIDDPTPRRKVRRGPGAAEIVESADDRAIRLRLPDTLTSGQVPPEIREARDEHKAEMLAELGAVTTRLQQEPFSGNPYTPRASIEPSPFTNGDRLAPEAAVERWTHSDGYQLGAVTRLSRDGGLTVRRITGLKGLR